MRRTSHAQQSSSDAVATDGAADASRTSSQQEQQRRQRAAVDSDSDPDPEVAEDDPTRTVAGGLTSRRRMHDSYQIISQNDVDRLGGQNDTQLTVSRGPAFFPALRTRVVCGVGGDDGWFRARCGRGGWDLLACSSHFVFSVSADSGWMC